MSDPYLAEIRIFSFNFAPRGWAMCNGQLLPINQNQALFSLLGTTYGGNGTINFALPDLRGRVPFHIGNGHAQGEKSGESLHTLALTETPGHTHSAAASAATATASNPVGNLWADGGKNIYSPAAAVAMAAGAIGSTGGSGAHENRAPFLTLNVCIALVGIYPSRN